VRAADVVITMGCGDACPIYPGKRYEDWQVADPSQASLLDEVRQIRDDIDERVRRLLEELHRAAASSVADSPSSGSPAARSTAAEPS
jgi:hypothetical protein